LGAAKLQSARALITHATPLADVANNSAIAFVNNGLMYLFSNMKYFLGTQQIEYFENAGVTTTIHNYLTTSKNTAGQINI